MPAWRVGVTSNGKAAISFKKPESWPTWRRSPLLLPCGNCIGCRLDRSRETALRCMDEAQMHEDNCFITLTYDEVKLPEDGSLVLKDFQLFMKKLREWSNRHDRNGKVIPEKWQGVMVRNKIKFYHCGEYGDKFGRPHYHACLFGFDFPDRVYHHSNRSGNRLYTSKILDGLWEKGIAIVGDVTFETAAYVARYVLKKVNGDAGVEHYCIDKDSGVCIAPEYVTMSRNPGIGKSWYGKFKSDCFPSDVRVVRGREMLPPKYYGSLFEVENPEGYAKIKSERVKRFTNSSGGEADTSPRRLRVREEVKMAQIKSLKRSYEI